MNSDEECKLTGRHSQSGSPTLPGVWKMDKSASPEVLGCRLNSFPATEVTVNISYSKGKLITVANIT